MDDIFLGRDRQMQDLERVLDEFFDARRTSILPPVALISGQGGIGKSTLLRELHGLAEQLYRGRFHLLHVDWQTQRQENPSFAVDPRQIDALAILRAIHRLAADTVAGWKAKKNDYIQAIDEIDKAATAAVRQAGDLRNLRSSPGDRTTGIADGAASTVAKAAASLGGVPGKVLEPFLKALARFGVQIVPDLAAALRDKLQKTHADLLIGADQHAARGLGETLRKAAINLPILVTFDTYEIIDERDAIVRAVIRAAGPRVAWVVAGRRDLYETRTSTPAGRVDGYREEDRHAYAVTRLDLTALAREEIREYFRQAAPERPLLDDDALVSVDRATGAIPLAIKMAAEIWRDTGEVAEILSAEQLTAEDIVEDMVGRYEQHCVIEDDRRTLAALVLADGDSGVLKAVLLPDHDGDEKRFREHLDRVRHRYAAVQHTSAREPRLHDEPARFFRERLRSRALREQDWLRELNDRAVKALCQQIDKLVRYHLRLEELCEDDDYVDASVKVARHLFWRDGDQAWPWWTARYVEGLAYSPRLREGLLEEAARWKPHLGQRGRKRLTVFQNADTYSWQSAEQQARRKLLEDDARRGWLADRRIENRHEQERQAIRLWSAADAFRQGGRNDQALECLRSSQQRSVELKSGLSLKITALAQDVGYQFYLVKDYKKAEETASLAVTTDPSDFRAWGELGTYYSLLKEYEKAIEHHKKAIEINNEDHHAWRDLGNDYFWLKDYEKAIEHCKKAIEINNEEPHAWGLLAMALCQLGRYDEASVELQRCLDINADAGLALNWRGHLHMIAGEQEKAIRCFERSITADGNLSDPYYGWSLLLYRAGDWTAAAEKCRQAMALDSEPLGARLSLLALRRLLEEPDDPQPFFENTRRLVESGRNPMFRAQWLAISGETNLALDKLAQAVQERPDRAVNARFRPAFHTLRDHPRFIELTADAPGSKWKTDS